MEITESYVNVTEEIVDTPAIADVSSPFLVAGAIKAPRGSFDVKYFNLKSEFLKEYTLNGVLEKGHDITLQNALLMLEVSPILVCRACGTVKPERKVAIIKSTTLLSVESDEGADDFLGLEFIMAIVLGSYIGVGEGSVTLGLTEVGGVFNLVLTEEGKTAKKYVFSLDPTAVDANQNPLHYTSVLLGTGISVVEGTESKEGNIEAVTLVFDGTTTADVSSISVADADGIHWESLLNYEDLDVTSYCDFGADCAESLVPIANANHSLVAASLPNLLRNITSGTGIWAAKFTTGRVRAISPFARTFKYGFPVLVAPSVQYLRSIALNIIKGREYDSSMEYPNGVVEFADLLINYNKKQRVDLLKMRIASIIYKEKRGAAYINDNCTSEVLDSPMKEEQNRRLANRFAQELEELINPFKGKLNTPSFRQTIESVVDNYFKKSPYRSLFDDYVALCNNDTLNPPALQRQGKVKIVAGVRFFNTGKYFDILNKLYPVGVDMTTVI